MDETTWQFEHSVECDADRSFAWSFWTDVSNWERLEGKAVEWIELKGAFAVGTKGITKTAGQNPHYWEITQLDPERSATIEIPLDGATFYNVMRMESIDSGRTRIIQCLGLSGIKAQDFGESMQMFENSAPQGLEKLAKTIESAYKEI
ncbi:hypothetical protein [Maribacter sp. 2307UL18-2]|uniref:hypothetical protein n=1 Tax=Maribacter sp. 2307UL18-2 TaxID=3386274 RepID=UPI0039BCEE57